MGQIQIFVLQFVGNLTSTLALNDSDHHLGKLPYSYHSIQSLLQVVLQSLTFCLHQQSFEFLKNYFLELVWPTLPVKRDWRLLIDSKRPASFESKYLPKGLVHHFHYDDPEKTRKWLDECEEIHVLHPHYHYRPHIWHFEDKFKKGDNLIFAAFGGGFTWGSIYLKWAY